MVIAGAASKYALASDQIDACIGSSNRVQKAERPNSIIAVSKMDFVIGRPVINCQPVGATCNLKDKAACILPPANDKIARTNTAVELDDICAAAFTIRRNPVLPEACRKLVNVVAGIASQIIRASAAAQYIVACPAVNIVIACKPEQRVIATVTIDVVIGRRAR